jgi:restriction system protein
MSIPDYQTLMLPLLKAAGDGQEHRTSDVADRLATDLKLAEEERQQLLPSGKQTTFANRVAWAKTYLVQAGLLEATKRAHFHYYPARAEGARRSPCEHRQRVSFSILGVRSVSRTQPPIRRALIFRCI